MANMVLDKKIIHWKHQLLDLGKRNKMIHYRETKRTTIKIVEPSFSELFQRIAVDEEELTFQRPIDRDSDIRTFSILALLESLSYPIPVSIGDIKTEGSIIERQKTLRNMRAKSRLALDEQGINILYMVAGFVEWKDGNGANVSWIKSPIILVPVSLTIESINAPFTLKRYEDDIVVNPTLSYLFETQYGITLPAFDPDEQSIDDFMDNMKRLVDKKGWKIIKEISLGLLSFLKINMYKDLDNNYIRIVTNPIIRALSGESDSVNNIPEELQYFNHDSVSAKDCYQVVNADSSQQDAILLSQKGVSFVMQGPPGTGKSQTITNIIAEALADGKKVLFVSEKMAALQVVYKRLSEVHLSDFCLPLHSYKANKKEIYNELEKTLQLKQKPFRVKEEAIAELDELDIYREQLNQYAEELHRMINPLGLSIYQVYGFLNSLDANSDILFEVSDIEKITKEQFNKMQYYITNFASALYKMGDEFYSNPWNGTNINTVTYELKENIKKNFTLLAEKLDSIIPITEKLENKYDLTLASSWRGLQSIIEVLESAVQMLSVPLEWIFSTDLEKLMSESVNNCHQLNKYQIKANEIKQLYSEKIFDIEAICVKQKFAMNIKSLTEKVKHYSNDEYEVLSNISTIQKTAKALLHQLEKLILDAECICTGTGYYDEISFATIKNIYHLAKNVMACPNISKQWFSDQEFLDVKYKAQNAQNLFRTNKKLIYNILSNFQQAFLQLDGKELLRKFDGYSTIADYISKINSQDNTEDSKTDINIEVVSSFVSTTVKDIKKLLSIWELVHQTSRAFTLKYKMPLLKCTEDIDNHIIICNGILAQIMPTSSWGQKDQRNTIKEIIINCKNVYYQIKILTDKIIQTCEEKVFEIDSESILNRYKTEYTSFFKYFRKTYRQDRKVIRAVYKDVLSKLKDSTVIALLQDLKALSGYKKWLSDNDNMIRDCIGAHYQGEKTFWDGIGDSIDVFDQVSAFFANTADGINVLSVNDKDELKQIKQYVEQLNDLKDLHNICTRKGISENITDFNIQNMETVIGALEKFASKSESFYDDFKAIVSHCLKPDAVNDMTFASVLDSLKMLQEIQQNEQWLSYHENILKSYFGLQYKGDATDWEIIESDIECFDNIISCCKNKGLPAKLQTILLQQSGNEVFPGLEKLADTEAIEELLTELSSFIVFEQLPKAEINVIAKILREVQNLCEGLHYNYDLLAYSLKKKREIHEVLTDLDELIYIQKIEKDYEEREEEYHQLYAGWFAGLRTDWVSIVDKILYTQKFKNITDRYNLSKEFVIYACTQSFANYDFTMFLNEMKKTIDADGIVCWAQGLFYQEICLENMPLSKLDNKIKSCARDLSALERWLDYRDSRTVCKKADLASFIESIENMPSIIPDIPKAFCKGFYRKWLDKMSLQLNSVSQFRSRIQNERVENFCSLDDHQLRISQGRIREKLISGLPSTNSFMRAKDEMSTLLNELNKKRRMPLRKLFKSIPTILMKLKPCLLMSPLSVSYFLEAETYQFDMVIFDEASQIFPEDAVGAIFRGKQVIIAGDSKQLPPTNYFSKSIDNNDDSYDSDSDEDCDDMIYNSILEEAASSLPNRSLMWHYRSKHEDLIAFSNHEIYKNSLFTFPSSVAKASDIGVEYVYVPNGIYEARCNIHEARKCVMLVLEHIQRYPKRSLGIVAFSEKQQATIEEAIRKFRERLPEFEEFFDENKEEPFFIKNLENVQGDERDTIIFSICYAKDKNGKMYMRFGPLGHQGGERRLNVAITRAKYNVKLVGSILPADIDLNRTNSEGIRMLRSYIEFSMKGSAVLHSQKGQGSLENNEDRFCHTVSEFLKQNGYKVQENVGCSDYTIDIAIENPEQEGCFIAGIECDGNSYVMSRTTRDRDHLRANILKNIGWKMYRVWSTDWIRDPQTVQTQLLDFIKAAIINNADSYNKIPTTDSVYELPIIEIASAEIKEEQELQKKVNINPYGFEYYQEANWWDTQYSNDADNETRVAESVLHVVKIEQPIHMDLLYRRLAGSFDHEKATAPVRNTIDSAIKRKLRGKVKLVDNFISMVGSTEIKVRIPKDGDGERPIEYISIPEIAAAMKIIANNAFGILQEELSTETARIFGFERRGPKITKAMYKAIDYLYKHRGIKIVDDKVQVVEGEHNE